ISTVNYSRLLPSASCTAVESLTFPLPSGWIMLRESDLGMLTSRFYQKLEHYQLPLRGEVLVGVSSPHGAGAAITANLTLNGTFRISCLTISFKDPLQTRPSNQSSTGGPPVGPVS